MRASRFAMYRRLLLISACAAPIVAPGPNRFSLAFTPDPVAFHVEAQDPLDP